VVADGRGARRLKEHEPDADGPGNAGRAEVVGTVDVRTKSFSGHGLRQDQALATDEGPPSVRTAAPRVIAATATATGATATHHRADDALRDAHERFHTAFHRAPIGLALVALNGEILHVNLALCGIVGYPHEILMTMPFQDLSHPDDNEGDSSFARQLLAGQIPSYSVEKRFFHADGHIVWVNVSASIVRGAGGTPDHFIAHIEDVTERKRVEESLRRESATVRLLKSVATAANSASHPDEAFASALDAVCAHAGWPIGLVYYRAEDTDELVPSDIWHIDDAAQFADLPSRVRPLHRGEGLSGRVLATGRPTWVGEFTADRVAADGRTVETGLKGGGLAFPVLVGSEIVAVLTFFSLHATQPDQDLLELMANVGTQLGRVVERARLEEQQERLDAARSRFVANAAHELRTPLATLRMVAGLLGTRRDSMTADQIEECCDLLERQGHNLDALVGDLLDLTRIEHDDPVEARDTVAVDELVARATETAPPPDRVTLTIELQPGLTAVGHPDRLNRVLVNLLTNAYRHGGRSVYLSSRVVGRETIVAVEDDGDGVPAELVANLFEPFTRATDGREPGHGLGLAIAAGIVERLGGRISYTNPPSGGARFTVRVPTAP
jgi:PAS domain S-box-containing protein